MVDLAAVAFVIILVIAVVFAAVTYHNKQARLRNRKISKRISVYCESEGEQPLLVGSACTSDDDFSLKIEMVRSVAHQNVAALGRKWKIVEHSN